MFITKQFPDGRAKLKTSTSKSFIYGYAAVYSILDLHDDIIMKYAFNETVANKSSLPLLWQHDHTRLIGKCTYFKSDDYGLFIKAFISDSSFAKEIEIMLKEGLINNFSIGMQIQKTSKYQNARIIEKAELFEISLVTFPAQIFAKITNINWAKHRQSIF